MRILFFIIILFTSLVSNTYGESFVIESFAEAKALSESAELPLLVIFGTPSCRFCEQLKHDLLDKEFENELSNVIVCYVDIDTDNQHKQAYNIKTIPDSRILFKNREHGKIIGYSKQKFKAWLKDYHDRSK